MSIMNTELYDALLSAGAGEEKARAAASAIGDVNQDINQDVNQLATKADIALAIANLKAELLKWMRDNDCSNRIIIYYFRYCLN